MLRFLGDATVAANNNQTVGEVANGFDDVCGLEIAGLSAVDVEDLDDAGWKVASKEGRIVELGSLGEGAGGAVTRCILKGGKTVFALKVCYDGISVPEDIQFTDMISTDHHNRPQPRC